MIARKHNYAKQNELNRRRVEKPLYGLKSYKADGDKATHAVKKKSPSTIKVPKVAPWKMILITMALSVVGFVYLTHVFATQEILEEVTELRRAHETAKRSHAEYSLTYDRKTGPAEITNKASTRGFIYGGAADPIIQLKK
ncbi:MAG: hypothetical protein WD491_01615 [Balneolales bacterium]